MKTVCFTNFVAIDFHKNCVVFTEDVKVAVHSKSLGAVSNHIYVKPIREITIYLACPMLIKLTLNEHTTGTNRIVERYRNFVARVVNAGTRLKLSNNVRNNARNCLQRPKCDQRLYS
jgi:hypothetical protein